MSMALVPAVASSPATLRKRRSCELVNTPSPCVRKALFHLGRLKELLRIALENPISIQDELKLQDFGKHPKGWKHLRFDLPLKKSSSSLSTLSEISAPSTDDLALSVTGIGGQLQEIESGDNVDLKNTVHVTQLERKNQLPPHEVFNQVRELILRLEEDRRIMLYNLAIERDKVETLSQKVDAMCQRRLIQLPLAVQKEHDACATDISELLWHVAYTERQLERCKERVQVAEVLNTRLKDDISFVKKHCPLVEEKLLLEKDAMKKIRAMQKQTDKELAEAKLELQKAEEKYQEASEKAENERQTTKEKLEGIRGQLRLLKKDFQHSEAMYKAYLNKAEQSRQKLASQEEELADLEKRAEDAKDEEQAEIYRIEDLRAQTKQVEFETGEVNKQKLSVEDEIEHLHQEMKSKITEADKKYHNSLKNLRELQEENRNTKLDIEDMTEEITSCEKIVAKSEKEIERYKKEREKCDSQLKEASAEVAQVTVINTELKNQLQKEESKSQAMEDALKTQAESLRKHVLEEMRQKAALEAKKQHNSQALIKGKSENKKKRKKVTNLLDDTINAVSKVQDDVDKLKSEYETTSQVVKELETKLTTVQTKHRNENERLVAIRDELLPQEKQLMGTQLELQSQIREMQFEEDQMRQKLKDMTVSRNSMEKRVATTEESILSVTEELDEVNIRLDASKRTNEELQKQLDEAIKRLKDRKAEHTSMMESRTKVKEKLEQSIIEELDQNKILAQKYRDLQSEHIDLKNRLMSLYDNKVKLEASIKDHKQLLALQEKFNLALKQYYFDRGEFNKAGLEKFHFEAEDNSKTMVKVQEGLQKALVNISRFLKTQVDGGAANQVHEAAMRHLIMNEDSMMAV